MEKNLEEEKKFNGKCTSCGASIKQDEKVCSYCGTPNVYYKEHVVPDIVPPKRDIDSDVVFDFGGMLGGMVGGMMMGGILRGLRGGRPPRRRR